ncbi:MAG: YihY/virulence factor BrkB family protein [Elainellaceae cyanobacterium]
MKQRLKQLAQSGVARLLLHTFLKWQQDECLEMGAALAYYALFSLFPLILVMLSIFGLVVGPSTYAYEQLLLFAQINLPESAYAIVSNTLNQLNQSSARAGITGFVILLITASGFFGALNRSFEKIWRTQPHQPKRNVRAIAQNLVLRRLFAFSLVLGAVLLLFVSLLSNLVVGVVLENLKKFSASVPFIAIDDILLVSSVETLVAFLLLTLVVTTLFKILPSVWVTWRDVWLGGLITSMLLMLSHQLVGNSIISLGNRFQSYGVLGGVMVLLLWIYVISQIFFLGGELTYAYARLFGSRRT